MESSQGLLKQIVCLNSKHARYNKHMSVGWCFRRDIIIHITCPWTQQKPIEPLTSASSPLQTPCSKCRAAVVCGHQVGTCCHYLTCCLIDQSHNSMLRVLKRPWACHTCSPPTVSFPGFSPIAPGELRDRALSHQILVQAHPADCVLTIR
jgi:hypothetical protein